MRRVAYVVSVDMSHFDTIAELVKPLYSEDPLDFLFIGPSGFYVRQVADRLAQRIGRTINRDAFRVINQYVTELLKASRFDAQILDRDFYTIYISKIIDELYEEERTKDVPDSGRLILLRTLSKSNTVVQYIVELFERSWELELYGEGDNASGYYSLVEDLMNDGSTFGSIIAEILARVRESVTELLNRNVYDPMSVYRWYVEEAEYVEKPRKHLVLSGFFDLPPLLRKALSKMFEKAENVTFFVWQKIEDRAFKELDGVYEFLTRAGFSFDRSLCGRANVSLGEILSKKDVTGVLTESVFSEHRYVVKRVKDLILEGIPPDEVGIVVPNKSVASILMDELDEAKVPYRYNGSFPLTDSKIVRILLQPLVTIEEGFRSEELLALIESPLVPERDLTMDEIEELFKEYDYFSVRLSPSELRDKSKVRSAYFERLDADIAHLQRKYEEYEIEEDVYASSLERLDKLKRFRSIMDSALSILEEAIESRNADESFFTWFHRFIAGAVSKFELALGRALDGDVTLASLGNEIVAFGRFVETLRKLESYVAQLKEVKTGRQIRSWSKLYRFLLVLLNATGYRETYKSANVVDIMDPATARFVAKRYKIFVDFTDDYYPSMGGINPLYYRASSERTRLFELAESNERRNAILSVVFSEHAELVVPKATNSGDTLVPSKYLGEFARTVTSWAPTPGEFYSELDYKVYTLRKKEKQVLQLKYDDFVVGQTPLSEFSHSKLASYLKCPLRFYFGDFVGVSKPVRASEKFDMIDGLIVHRVLRRFFEKPTSFGFSGEELEAMIREEYQALYGDGIFRYSVPRELKVRKILESISPMIKDFVESKRLINLKSQSFTAGKFGENGSEDRSLVSKTVVALEQDFRINFGRYELIVRIDRIDKLDRNLDPDSFDVLERPAYAVIDYKHSTTTQSAQIEQLLLYDLVLEKVRSERLITDSDRFLIFLTTKTSSRSYSYTYLKRAKSEDGEDRLLIPAKSSENGASGKAGRKSIGITEHVAVEASLFEEWLVRTLESITLRGDFVPVFIKRGHRGFHAFISSHIPTDLVLQVPKGSKEAGQCWVRSNNGVRKCPYESVCSLMEVYGVRLVGS